MSNAEFVLFVRLVVAFEQIAKCVKSCVVQTEDVARAKVYSEHLGGKLKPQEKPEGGEK